MVLADSGSARIHRRTQVFKAISFRRHLPTNCARVAHLPAVPDCAVLIALASGNRASSSSRDCRVCFGARPHRRLAQFPRIVALWLACASLLMPAPFVSGDGDGKMEQPYGCPNCLIPHDVIRQYTLNEIKHSILSKLGFEQVPNITNRLPTTENMLINTLMNDMVNKPLDGQHIRHKPYLHEIQNDESLLDDEDDDKLRNTYMVAVAKSCSTESYCKTYKSHYPLTFVFEPKTTKAKVLSAKLSFYQRQLLSTSKNADTDTKVNITIYKLSARQHYVSLLSTEEKLSTSSKWIEIDFKEHLEKHFKGNNSLSLNLVIIATHPNKEIISKLVTEIQTEEEPLFPFLQIRTDEQRINKRSKRSNHMDCKDADKYTKCCRYPLTVDFDAFQWDFIIAPRKYEAYYCAGECGPLSNQKYAHTHLTYLTPPANNTHWPITPCCTPRKMGPISMVFYGQEGNVHFGILPGMVVQRCGCA